MKAIRLWPLALAAVAACGGADSGSPAGNGLTPMGAQQPPSLGSQNGSAAASSADPQSITTSPSPDASAAAGQGGSAPTMPVPGEAGTGANGTPPDAVADGDPSTPAMNDGAGCATEGLELEGLMYSPGGTLLPFPCEPFHPTTNNPYAVRCTDAWSWYETEFPGDEFCILPPEPGQGIQVGVHPQGMDWYEQVSGGDMSGYENVPDEFIMGPGQEEERNYITGSPNSEEIYYYRNNVRMRAGSHHMIVNASDPGAAGGARGTWIRGSAGGLGGGSGIPGAQRPDENVPKTLEKPPEDVGLYGVLGPDRDVTYNMHHFNSTDVDTLKEAWENLWFEEDRTVRSRGIFGMPITQAIGTFAQPGQTVDFHYSWNITQETRIISLFGHRHAWTTNFVAWVERPEGEEIVYQSFDWFDQPTYRYDSQVKNPEPMPEARQDGGHTGVLTLMPGEQLHFNCHITFTPERAAAEEAPLPSSIGPLRFANQAFQGEMCILFGSTAGVGLPGIVTDPGPLPDFATIE